MESATESKPPTGDSSSAVRLKRWCKRPPAPAETWVARQAPPGATSNRSDDAARRASGRRHEPAGNGRPRWMTVLDRIPLTDRLTESPANAGLSHSGNMAGASPGHHDDGACRGSRATRPIRASISGCGHQTSRRPSQIVRSSDTAAAAAAWALNSRFWATASLSQRPFSG